MQIPIIYEDDVLLVIDKPGGLVVNKSESANRDTLQSWAQARFNISESGDSDFASRAGIVHRLDKDTSGLLIIAKSESAFISLQGQFFLRRVVKNYTTLVHGKLAPETGIVKAPVARLPGNRKKFGVVAGGRDAQTEYHVTSFYQFQNSLYSLLKIIPLSGRTHQIRIHLKYLGYPIVGDNLYAGKKYSEQDKELTDRIFLHACYLRFEHPITGKWMELKSDLPEDLLNVVSKLTKL